MEPKVRPNISVRNPYHLSTHRFYELKHFCLQYPEWQKARNRAIEKIHTNAYVNLHSTGIISDPTSSSAIEAETYSKKMKLVEDSLMKADPELYPWMLKAVAFGIPFTALQTLYGIPACRDTFYDRYRKFFFILSNMKN